jgi:hypothetical protein
MKTKTQIKPHPRHVLLALIILLLALIIATVAAHVL